MTLFKTNKKKQLTLITGGAATLAGSQKTNPQNKRKVPVVV